jgi:hypothetical protein
MALKTTQRKVLTLLKDRDLGYLPENRKEFDAYVKDLLSGQSISTAAIVKPDEGVQGYARQKPLFHAVVFLFDRGLSLRPSMKGN